MSRASLEIANAYAKIVAMVERSLNPETEEYAIHWEDAIGQIEGLDPELKPVVLTLLKSERADIRAWVERQTGALLADAA